MIRQMGRREEGQVLPLTILLMLVLMGILAMVLDGGFAFVQKRRMQNAADAGALSATVSMVKGEYRDAVLRQTVTQYAQINGAATVTMKYIDAGGNVIADPTNGLVPTSAKAISVTTHLPFATFFARVMGISTMTAAGQARAMAVPGAMPGSSPGMSPLSVPTNFFSACSSATSRCDVWDSSYASAWGIPANQYKSLIDVSNGGGGSTSDNIRNWTEYGYGGTVNTNTWLPTVTGNHGNNVADALRSRITAHPGGIDPDGVVWGTVDMAIWDSFRTSDNNIHVAKFARFKIRMTDIYSSQAYGHFVSWMGSGHDRGPDTDPVGPMVIVLR